ADARWVTDTDVGKTQAHRQARVSQRTPDENPKFRNAVSVAGELREAIRVVIGVAEGLARGARPLHEESDVELVGDADAAVHLHRFVGREPGHVARLGLGRADQARHAGLIRIERLQTPQYHRTHQLD